MISKLKNRHELSLDELVEVLSTNFFDDEILKASAEVKERYVGRGVHVKGLLEFSNICARNCFYCGLRKGNDKIKRYKLEPEKIIELAKRAAEVGYKTIVMQSGESDTYEKDEMCFVIREIKKLGVSLTLSIGEKTEQEYRAYKDAGADRFLLRIETTDPNLYQKLHPKMSHQNRFECLKILKKLGYETGSGSLVGLPNQSVESIARDLLFFKEMDADMIGIGPFIPHPDTPLKDENGGNFEFALKVTALVRLLLPEINIPATTAMETLRVGGRLEALKYASNVIMPNVTQGDFGTLFALYPGKPALQNGPLERLDTISNDIRSIGLYVSNSDGNSVKFNKRKINA